MKIKKQLQPINGRDEPSSSSSSSTAHADTTNPLHSEERVRPLSLSHGESDDKGRLVPAAIFESSFVKKRTIRRGHRRDSPDYRHRLIPRLILGGVLGSIITSSLLGILYLWNPCLMSTSWWWSPEQQIKGSSCSSNRFAESFLKTGIRGRLYPYNKIQSYLDLFNFGNTTWPSKQPNEASPSQQQQNQNRSRSRNNHRSRQLESSNSNKDPQIVIAGKMSVEDAPCNIAQYNIKKSRWSLEERIQLSLYNSYSGGEVYSLLANHTEETNRDKGTDSSMKRHVEVVAYDVPSSSSSLVFVESLTVVFVHTTGQPNRSPTKEAAN
jgi:hypothetical protein